MFGHSVCLTFYFVQARVAVIGQHVHQPGRLDRLLYIRHVAQHIFKISFEAFRI